MTRAAVFRRDRTASRTGWACRAAAGRRVSRQRRPGALPCRLVAHRHQEHARGAAFARPPEAPRRWRRSWGGNFGHELPDGLARNRGGERFGAGNRRSTCASGLRRTAPDCRGSAAAPRSPPPSGSPTARSPSSNALWERGYQLAQGDQRGFVVVDRAGHVHSLSRQIDGARAKDIKAKLAPRTPEDLPTVKETRKRIAAEREERGARPGGRAAPQALAGAAQGAAGAAPGEARPPSVRRWS